MGKKYRKEKRKPDKSLPGHTGYRVGKLYYFLAIFISVVMVLSLVFFITADSP